MTDTIYFPAVSCDKNGDGQYRASAALRLESVLSPLLRKTGEKDGGMGMRENALHHLALLKALAGWPENVQISLNIITRPDNDYPMGGKLLTALVVSVLSRDREKTMAGAIGRHDTLASLVHNFFPELEWKNVVRKDELASILQPFVPKVVKGIVRRRDMFTVSRPRQDNGGAAAKGIGFLASGRQTEQGQGETTEIPHLFPWSTAEWRPGDLTMLAEALLANPAPLWFQVHLRSTVTAGTILRDKRNALHTCENLLGDFRGESMLFFQQLREMRSMFTERLQELTSPCVFRVGTFLCSTTRIDEALTSAVAAVIAPDPAPARESKLSLFGGFEIVAVKPSEFSGTGYCVEKEPYTVAEAVSIFRLPYPQRRDMAGVPTREYRTIFARPSLLRECPPDGLLLGDNIHRGFQNEIRLSNEDRMRHMAVFGQTGTGKSTLLSNMIIQDIERGHGLCLVDPHGDLVADVLHRFPKRRRADLVLVDMLDERQIMPMNLLAWQSPDERDFLIDELYTWLDHAYDMRQTGGPMFELYFRTFLRIVMGDAPRTDFTPTINDFMCMFNDRDFREYCQDTIKDEQVLYMLKQANRAGGDASLENIAPYITSKLNRFTLDHNMKRMIGQEEMIIDFVDVMERSKVMLVNLGRGRYGEKMTSLLATQLVARFKSAAMKRVNIPHGERRDFFLYVDEFQNVASEDFVTMLSEARKFRLGLILANQYAEQLDAAQMPGRSSVLQAILGNVGTMINFRLGIRDAEVMESAFVPDFNRFDLTSLPLGYCYVNVKTGGNRPMSLSLRTRYRKPRLRPEFVEELRAISNTKYAVSPEQADRNLIKRTRKIDKILESWKEEGTNRYDGLSSDLRSK